MFIQGRLLKTIFHYHKKCYHLEYMADPGIKKPTEFFVPSIHFGTDYEVQTNNANIIIEKEKAEQKLKLSVSSKEKIIVTKRKK